MTERTCVVYNPASGRGRAARLVGAMRRKLGDGRYAWAATERPGHAEELARWAALDGFDRVVAAGGDGTVHEVANGLLDSGRGDVVFSTWPAGSANDYAYALAAAPGRRAVDVGRVTGGGRSRWFVNGLGVGFNGAVTLESRSVRWLTGMPKYAWALLKAAARHFATPEMEVVCDGSARRWPTLAVSVSLGPREGGFPLFPAARLDDGLFDTLHCGPVTRLEMLRQLPAMATGSLPAGHPKFALGTARRVEVRSGVPLRAHLDGEFFCHPEDGVRDLVVELHSGRLRVETYAPGERGA